MHTLLPVCNVSERLLLIWGRVMEIQHSEYRKLMDAIATILRPGVKEPQLVQP